VSGILETLAFFRDPGFAERRFDRHGDVFETVLLGQPMVFIRGGAAIGDLLAQGEAVEGWWPESVRQLLGSRSLANRNGPAHRARLLARLQQVLEQAPQGRGGLDLLAGGLDEAGLPLGDADLVEQLLLLLFAGYETTASSLSCLMRALLLDPALEDWLRVELDTLPWPPPGTEAPTAYDSAQDEISSQLAEVESRELAHIENALDRMKGGKYGLCEVCNGTIPMVRLHALPYATMCIDCQRESERSGGIRREVEERSEEAVGGELEL
jgi:RNA polymerase-binding transcription factor DksA